MKTDNYEYYSFRYYEASEQWQAESKDSKGIAYWDTLDSMCETLSNIGWEPILLSDHLILFRRKDLHKKK
jgi:hypothetical protein